jgi:3-methylcrotonyl-CoA carboxylase alpha subunit
MGRVVGVEAGSVKLSSGERTAEVRLEEDAAVIDGRRVKFRQHRTAEQLVALEIEGQMLPVRARREKRRAWVWCGGRVYEFEVASGRPRMRESSGDLLAPMPGVVRRVEVSPGSPVVRGQTLMILEAMKMEHAIRAPRDGTVSRIAYGEGDQVERGVPLVEITERNS